MCFFSFKNFLLNIKVENVCNPNKNQIILKFKIEFSFIKIKFSDSESAQKIGPEHLIHGQLMQAWPF